MGTNSITTIFNDNNIPIIRFYKHLDGNFEVHGADLQEFLKDTYIISGMTSARNGIKDTAKKFADGMEDLAAQVLTHFKSKYPLGTVYIAYPDDIEAYHYSIKLIPSKNDLKEIALTGISVSGKVEKFPLYDFVPSYKEIAQFVYKTPGKTVQWRRIGVTERTKTLLYGIDLNDDNKFKAFKVDNIVGGWEKVISVPV